MQQQRHSIFERLIHSPLQAPTMEASSQQAPAMPSFFSISPPSPPRSSWLSSFSGSNSPSSSNEGTPRFLHTQTLPTAFSGSPYKKARSYLDLISDPTHTHPPPSLHNANMIPTSHSTTFLTPTVPPRTAPASNRNDEHKVCVDDGSIACKLLATITKSISSPSLHLASSKEAVRESSFQKALRLKQMKLQHCAEALGMESSDNSLVVYDACHCITPQETRGTTGRNLSLELPTPHRQSGLKSVRSLPSLTTARSRYTRSSSFPPPLSHTLPASSSQDSLSLSLCAYRKDGRFILKETMVPSTHYLQASRKNGRLTLHFFTREEEDEEHLDSKDETNEDSKYKDCQEGRFVEQEVFGCMVSSYEETQEAGFEKKEAANVSCVCDEVRVKKSLSKMVDMASRGTEIVQGNRSLDHEGLHRLNGHIANYNGINQEYVLDKGNIISSTITLLSLQASRLSHSKVTTLHNLAHISSYPLVYSAGSLRQSAAIIHSSNHERNHEYRSIMSNPHSNETFVWESKLMPARTVCARSGRPCAPLNPDRGAGDGGGGRAGGPLLSLEEIKAESVVKVLSGLATSFILEASYGSRGNWWQAEKKKASPTILESGTKSGSANLMRGKTLNDKGPTFSHGAKFGDAARNGEEEASKSTSEGGMQELNIGTSSPLTLDLQFPYSSGNKVFQCSEEWLQTPHCKELFDNRHQLCQGFHCIPTRS